MLLLTGEEAPQYVEGLQAQMEVAQALLQAAAQASGRRDRTVALRMVIVSRAGSSTAYPIAYIERRYITPFAYLSQSAGSKS